MPQIKVYPAWRLSPQFDFVEVDDDSNFGHALGKHFEIHSALLHICDRDGRDFAISDLVPRRSGDASNPGEPMSIAVSTRPLSQTLGLFETIRWAGDGTSNSDSEDPVPGPPSLNRMTPDERRLGKALLDLGLDLDLHRLEPDKLAEGFPSVPPGFEVSPYRIFFAAAITVSEQTQSSLDQLDTEIESLARELADRLRIERPDAFDLRLHLFVDREGARFLATHFSRLDVDTDRSFTGAIHRGWRRIIVHPYLDDNDRLLQMINLGRSLSIERLEDSSRRQVQGALATFTPFYSRTEGKIFDFQRHVTLRSAEERLGEEAELLLLARLQQWLTGDSEQEASSGMATDLAQRVLARAGLTRQLDSSGTLLGEISKKLCGPVLAQGRDIRFGAPIRSLERQSDGQLREWIKGLSRGDEHRPLPDEELDRLFRTVAVDIACRVRSAIEQLIERDVLPQGADPELELAQFFAAMETLSQELQGFSDGRENNSIRKWLEDRAVELEARVAHATNRLLTTSDPLFSKLRRWFGRHNQTYVLLQEILEQLELDWVELQVLRRWIPPEPQADIDRMFEFVDQLLARFAALADEIRSARDELAAEIQTHKRAASLGSIEVPFDRDSYLEERLRREVEAVPVAAALAGAIRHRDGELRNLFLLHPADLLDDMLEELVPRLHPIVDGLATELAEGRLEHLLEVGIHELFVNTKVQPSGLQGIPGALDDQTCVLVLVSPRMHHQIPDLEEHISHQLANLPNVQTPPTLHVIETRLAPGVVLVRSVQALTLEQVVP